MPYLMSHMEVVGEVPQVDPDSTGIAFSMQMLRICLDLELMAKISGGNHSFRCYYTTRLQHMRLKIRLLSKILGSLTGKPILKASMEQGLACLLSECAKFMA